eukprot:jgi/Chlat1/8516/Chrsp80S07811
MVAILEHTTCLLLSVRSNSPYPSGAPRRTALKVFSHAASSKPHRRRLRLTDCKIVDEDAFDADRSPSTPTRSHGSSFSALNRDDAARTPASRSYPTPAHLREGDWVTPGDGKGAYKILRMLGTGGFSTTYEALNSAGEPVALKELSLRTMKDWKVLDMFHREARVMKSLEHPSIPEYLDSFEVDMEDDHKFYIVQRVAPGKSLAALVADGWRPTEAQVLWIAFQLLQVLEYLSSLRPPVVHRDVKPENVIVDLDKLQRGPLKSLTSALPLSGGVYLVDFGSVQDAIATSVNFGATTVGTWGYVAPEVYRGPSSPQADLYALGATLLFLISGGASPAEFPQKRLRLDLSKVAQSPPMQVFLEKLLEPVPEDRFKSARHALELLLAMSAGDEFRLDATNVASNTMLRFRPLQQPAGSKVVLRVTGDMLTIEIPPLGVTADTLYQGAFAAAWNTFTFMWTRTAMRGAIIRGLPSTTALSSLPIALFALPFWLVGAKLVNEVFAALRTTTVLEMNRERFQLRWKLLGKELTNADLTHRIQSVRICTNEDLDKEEQQAVFKVACMIKTTTSMHIFGRGLPAEELEWLVQEITAFLRRTGAPGYS